MPPPDVYGLGGSPPGRRSSSCWVRNSTLRSSRRRTVRMVTPRISAASDCVSPWMRTRSKVSRSSSGSALDGLEHTEAVRGEPRAAGDRRRHELLAQIHGGGLFIQASGQVIELPAHVLVGQREELAHGPGAGFADRLEQPLHHGAEQFVGLQVQRRLRQARVAFVEKRGAQHVQAAYGPVQQGPDDRLGGRISAQLVQVALDHDGSACFGHRAGPGSEGA